MMNEGCLKTWDSVQVDGVNTVYYFGGEKEDKFISNKFLLMNCDDSALSIAKKTITFFEYALKNFDFDFIYRTNLSSYINKAKLLEFLSNKPKKNFYSSIICRYLTETENFLFGSGAGFSISRDLVEHLVNNKEKLRYELPDDVMVGHGLQHVQMYPSERICISSLSSINSFVESKDNMAQVKTEIKANLGHIDDNRHSIYAESNLNNFKINDLKNYFSRYYHFRCKCESNRLDDILIMKSLHDVMSQNN
jgi:hypothetical protein